MQTFEGFRLLFAGLLARSQYASGRSCDRPIPSNFNIVFRGRKAKTTLVPIIRIALYISHAILSTLPKISTHCCPPNTNSAQMLNFFHLPIPSQQSTSSPSKAVPRLRPTLPPERTHTAWKPSQQSVFCTHSVTMWTWIAQSV
jgi:hypothetical protein